MTDTLSTLYGIIAVLTLGYSMGALWPKKRSYWLVLVILSALWPLFWIYVFWVERKEAE